MDTRAPSGARYSLLNESLPDTKGVPSATAAVDEAVRNAVAVGADPDRIAVLDNFCLGDPRRPQTMWTLLEAARGCHDAAVALGTPFVSGKDSFNNEYLAPDGARVSIPPSLLISAIGIVPDAGTVPGSDLKAAGDILYLVGMPAATFGGSVYAELFGLPAGADPAVPPFAPDARERYRSLHRAMAAGLVRACHDLSDGGLAAAVAEMCLGGRRGASIAIGGAAAPAAAVAALFGETNGCLLAEVAPASAAEFERIMAGSPLSRIGSTNDSTMLELLAGSASASIPLDDMAAAFSGARSER